MNGDPHTRVPDPQSARLPYQEQPTAGGWRKTFTASETCSKWIPHLGTVRYTTALAELPSHEHADCFELVLILSGHPHWQINGREYRLQPGDGFLTHPWELHGGLRSIMEPCELIFIQMIDSRPDPSPPLNDLLCSLQKTRSRQFTATQQLSQLMLQMVAECENPGPYAASAQESRLTLLLIALIACLSTPAAGNEISQPIRRVLRYVDDHSAVDIKLGDLRIVSGLCRSEFFRRFIRETGESPASFLTRRRIETAAQILRESDRPVTDIAFDLGFSSSQYFATVFKRHTGQTPRTFRDNAPRD